MSVPRAETQPSRGETQPPAEAKPPRDGGKTPAETQPPRKGFSSLLVANRGEIARRVFRTARNMGLRTVAVFAADDADTPFVFEADEAVRLREGYLNGNDVIAAALATGAEAIHPGYGFLAENAAFAQAVTDAGLIWVGPQPAVIKQMGDKIAAKEAATAVGLPVLASLPEDISGDDLGFPLLVKAAFGGGGKGMRLVSSSAELPTAVAAARREALSSFGDDTVFLERWLQRCRHIEVQILGDAYGSVVHLGERECSIQRRHQKLIEESPCVALDSDLRTAIGDAAIRLARAIGYSSTGTVEMLLDDTTGEFFFLEMNTRLQVEHPVTEAITGIDLVRQQLRVAAGEPLEFDQATVSFSGHAIEARLCAEDVDSGFLPATGTLAAFAPAKAPQVRWDSGVEAGTVIGLGFDSMLAKVIAHAPTRPEASARLALALEKLHLGGVTTNRRFLVAALRSAEFAAGDTTTDFVERVNPTQISSPASASRSRQQAAVATAMWLQASERRTANTLGWMPSGWRHGRLRSERLDLAVEGEPMTVVYQPRRDGSFDVSVTVPVGVTDTGNNTGTSHDTPTSHNTGTSNNTATSNDNTTGNNTGTSTAVSNGTATRTGTAVVVGWTNERIDLEWKGRRVRWHLTQSGDNVYVTGNSETMTVKVLPRFTVPGQAGQDQADGGFAAPMPGVVLEIRVATGEAVTKGQTMMVLEGMKMEHHVNAPSDGTVTDVLVAAGDQVDGGTTLLMFDQTTTNG